MFSHEESSSEPRPAPPAWLPPLRFAAPHPADTRPTFTNPPPSPVNPPPAPSAPDPSTAAFVAPVPESAALSPESSALSHGVPEREAANQDDRDKREGEISDFLDDPEDTEPGDDGEIGESKSEQILALLEQGFDEILQEIQAANTDNRRNIKRLFEILKQLSQMLDAVTGAVRDVHQQTRQMVLEAANQSAAKPTGQLPEISCTGFMEFFDRLGRIRAAADAPPPLPATGWFARSAVNKALAPWKEERARLRESLTLLEEHAMQLFRTAGIEPIPTRGKTFDPTCMIAVEVVTDTSLPDHSVVSEVLPGWRDSASGKILRPAQVRVSRKSPASR